MVRAVSTASNPPLAQPAPAFASLTASRDAATVQAVIRERWGFEPPLDYCRHLIAFVEEMSDGQTR
jgi:hypothetical protein